MSPQQDQTVRALLDAIVAKDMRAAAEVFAPDASYHVRAWEDPVIGTAAITAEFERQGGIFADFSYEILTAVSTDTMVFMERIDSMRIAGKPVSLHWASVVELDREGRITVMRDYYDTVELQNQLATTSAD
ncbi:MAG TPA: nuclear transport factor 2 family protein [Mycobacteriales bacterium]|jgi:limonene-1,2-epoxide hydrolase|nr:nuclear transport factor 2 family protein [Mycobacteriales bacterium]